MTKLNTLLLKGLFSLFFLVHVTVYADVKPAKIFSDNMVLQREHAFAVWGMASPGEKVTVTLGEHAVSGETDSKGQWMVRMPRMKAGGPYELSVVGKNTIVFKSVLLGDVWLASGQSNMEWKLNQNVNNHKEEISKATYSQIRFFTVPNRVAPFPKDDLEGGSWVVCTPETAAEFSAVAYFFGREIHTTRNVPVGLIDCTWGGTNAEAWTSLERLYTMPEYRAEVAEIREKKVNWESDIEPNNERTRKRIEIAERSNLAVDQGVLKEKFGDFEWNNVGVPEWNKDLEGVIWMRKSIEIPSQYKKEDLMLYLGKPSGTAQVYFNEQKIGEAYGPNFIELKVPGSLVKAGKNQLVVRLSNARYKAQLGGNSDRYYLASTTGVKMADLSGDWKYHNGLEPELPKIEFYHRYHASLFNGMVNPVVGYGLKGIIWYQGESNVHNARVYRELFPAMIDDWRVRWGQGYLPFLYVQLANFLDPASEPSESNWAEVREAQLMTLNYPNTGMAVTIDIGEQFDIHPRNKQDVGKRLALAAQKVAYGDDIVASGPIYQSAERDGSEIAVSFHYDTYRGGLVAKDGALKGFAIAGADKKFHWAKAQIVGGKVYVSSDKVKDPVAVRYAWGDNPECNLYNKAGLPASPFRTDDW